MGKASSLRTGIVDVAAVLFVVGGVASFVMSLLAIQLVNIALPPTFTSAIIVA